MKRILYVLSGVLAGFILAGGLLFMMRAPAGAPIVLQPAPTEGLIEVHVIGAVPRPGLYKLAKGARVQDAIDAAGGLLAEGNSDAVNLAALLEDGQQLNVPYKSGQQTISTPAPALPVAAPTAVSGDLLNINTATLEQLDTLPGIGPTTAQKIIDYRTEHGSFLQIEDIMNVSGIGPATFDDIKSLITV